MEAATATSPSFLRRTLPGTLWLLLIYAALKSEPLWNRVFSDPYAITNLWCGAWGCSASLPRLLAWQVPATLFLVPVAVMLMSRCRHARTIAVLTALGIAVWLTVRTIQVWRLDQIGSAGDIVRHAVYCSVVGTSLVIPTMLASLAVWCSHRGCGPSAANPHH